MSDEEQPEFTMVDLPVQESTIGDGDIIIFDIFEFCEATDSLAALNRDGNLFVFGRTSLKWANVEELGKPARKLTAVKKLDS